MAETNNPGIVFKALGGVLFLVGGIVSVIAILQGVDLTKWHIIIIAINIVSGMVMMSDVVRDKLLDFASWVPFIPFKRKQE